MTAQVVYMFDPPTVTLEEGGEARGTGASERKRDEEVGGRRQKDVEGKAGEG